MVELKEIAVINDGTLSRLISTKNLLKIVQSSVTVCIFAHRLNVVRFSSGNSVVYKKNEYCVRGCKQRGKFLQYFFMEN